MSGLTVDNKKRGGTKGHFYVVCDIDFDSSYPTGGESLTPGNVGLVGIDFCVITAKSGYVFEYDYTNQKLMAYWPDYNETTAGVLVEVANTTDLSGVTDVKGFFIGH